MEITFIIIPFEGALEQDRVQEKRTRQAIPPQEFLHQPGVSSVRLCQGDPSQ